MAAAPTVRVVGLPQLQKRLRGVQERLGVGLEVVGEEVFRLLELEAGHRFSMLAPYGVDTGAVRDSLTQPDAMGSIRENHGMEVTFGTSIWYAKFLRKIGGSSGVPRGREREGPNLFLESSAGTAAQATKLLQRYILEGLL